MFKYRKQGLPATDSVLIEAALFLQKNEIEVPRLEAELMLSFLLGYTRTQLHIRLKDQLSYEVLRRFEVMVTQRAAHMPIQYLVGKKDFMGRDFKLTPDVLIPRDDTAVLVEATYERLAHRGPLDILDIGTGSGIVAISLDLMLKDLRVSAVDISEPALVVAKDNAQAQGSQVEFIKSNLFASLTGRRFGAICSNPPYIPRRALGCLQAEVQREPILALDGGGDGLDFYRRLIKEAPAYLKSPGLLALEIASDQGAAVVDLFKTYGFKGVEVVTDMAGLDRVVLGWREDEDATT